MLPFGRTGGWPSVMAHRGGALLGPANSVEVLEAAAAAGADAVEIDVQELGDGSLVLFHDGSIVEGEQRYRLIDLDLAEFEALIGARAVMLAELPERLLPLRLGLYLDVKRVTARGLASLLDVIATSSVAESAVVGSFSTDTAAAVVADGRLPASVLYHDRTADPLVLAASIGCSFVHPCFDSDPWMVARLAGEWMERAHDAGLAVVGWNVNDPVLLKEMSAAGFDVLCTDDPRLIDRSR